MTEERITRELHWRKRLLSDFLAANLVVAAVIDEQAHPQVVQTQIKIRCDRKGNALLFTQSGFCMFVYDNLDLLTKRSGLLDYSGALRTQLVNEAGEKEEFYLSDDFLKFANGEFEKCKRKKYSNVTSDDDLKGNARDGAQNQMLDRPRAEPFEITCKRVKFMA